MSRLVSVVSGAAMGLLANGFLLQLGIWFPDFPLFNGLPGMTVAWLIMPLLPFATAVWAYLWRDRLPVLGWFALLAGTLLCLAALVRYGLDFSAFGELRRIETSG